MMFKPQVPREHYFKDYDTKERWISYWYQINEVLKTRPEKVLEVGIGNKTVSDYLRKLGITVVTADVDKSLEPDYVCSVTELSKYFNENEFDTVLCAEVLEHIPFEYFEKALEELWKVSKMYVILSLPHFGVVFSLSLKIPLLKRINITVKIPLPLRHVFDGQHYWEVGKKGYSLGNILKILSKLFYIKKTYIVPENPYHRFFILRVRK
uniref:Methyltransferase domain-containing protein n=1 Tax=Caldicellulosiruptor owensensis TaxID=55205 RepID=A0A7C5V3W0_9FIRM